MLNKVILIGRLTKDPELRTVNGGYVNCKFTLAVDRTFKKPGQPEADFIFCTAWGKTAETMCRYLHKGSLIAVEGRLETGSYDNAQGVRVYTTDVRVDNVQFLESKNSQQGYGQDRSSGDYGRSSSDYYGDNGAQGNSRYGNNSSRNSYQGGGWNGGSQSSFDKGPAAGSRGPNPYAQSVENDFSDLADSSQSFDVSTDDLPF